MYNFNDRTHTGDAFDEQDTPPGSPRNKEASSSHGCNVHASPASKILSVVFFYENLAYF